MADVFSDYIVFADESGDHGLRTINPVYPVFCLAFCIFEKQEYSKKIVPVFQEFKFRHWGHDAVVLHEADIRKTRRGDYNLLNNPKIRPAFMSDLHDLINQSSFKVTASVIQKERLRSQHGQSDNPYNLALLFCMGPLLRWLLQKGEAGKTVHIVFESRGEEEDRELELEFRRITNNETPTIDSQEDFRQLKFVPRFVPKLANHTGLQLADLIARPIALSVLKPNQDNRTYPVIERKYVKDGLKVFP